MASAIDNPCVPFIIISIIGTIYIKCVLIDNRYVINLCAYSPLKKIDIVDNLIAKISTLIFGYDSTTHTCLGTITLPIQFRCNNVPTLFFNIDTMF